MATFDRTIEQIIKFQNWIPLLFYINSATVAASPQDKNAVVAEEVVLTSFPGHTVQTLHPLETFPVKPHAHAAHLLAPVHGDIHLEQPCPSSMFPNSPHEQTGHCSGALVVVGIAADPGAAVVPADLEHFVHNGHPVG